MTIYSVFLQCTSFPLMTDFELYISCVYVCMLPLSLQHFVLVVV